MNKLSISMFGVALALAGCGDTAGDPVADGSSANGEQTAGLTVPAGVYELDPSHAILQFAISHFGTSDYHARLTGLDGTIRLDPENLSSSSVNFTVQANSVITNYPLDYRKTHEDSKYQSWDEDLGMDPKFLDGAKNPLITFKSTKVEQTGARTGKVTGDLTFRGITHPITLDVRFVGEMAQHMIERVPVVGFEAKGEILRTQFGMPADVLGATATIYFNGEFLRHGDLSQAPGTPTPEAN